MSDVKKKASHGARLGRSVRNNILFGLILLTPIVITGFVANWLFTFITNRIIAFVPKAFIAQFPSQLVWFRVAALLVVILMLFFIGLLARNIFGRRLYQLGDRLLARIPLINKIYLFIRQISETILDQSQTMFKEVVALEWPRKGLYAVGFVTAIVPPNILGALQHAPQKAAWIVVFVPTVPNPTPGFFCLVPREESHVLPLSVADAMKLMISAGAVFPGIPQMDDSPTLLDKLEVWLAPRPDNVEEDTAP